MLRSAISSYLVENMDTKERKKISEQHIKVASQRRMNNLSKEERIKRATL
ncbi:MAG: hypothetical protein LBH96_05120 [Candidatus Peribacteria bacterium]|jgi:hypothetical protein|nr:hypothetical protein [Candidatus Peribacteria bacterium]